MLMWLMNQGTTPFLGGSDAGGPAGPLPGLRTLGLTGAGLVVAGLVFLAGAVN